MQVYDSYALFVKAKMNKEEVKLKKENVQKAIRSNQDAEAPNRELVRNVGATISSSRSALVEHFTLILYSSIHLAPPISYLVICWE